MRSRPARLHPARSTFDSLTLQLSEATYVLDGLWFDPHALKASEQARTAKPIRHSFTVPVYRAAF